MNIISLKIYQKILEVARREEEELSPLSDNGIFFLPEIAFSYAVGKSIAKSGKEIFGTSNWKWQTELQLEGQGPSDLVFSINNDENVYVFEFKVRETFHSYIRDIDKLLALKSDKYKGYFCALIDSFDDNYEKEIRIVELEKARGNSLKRVGEKFEVFHTPDEKYEKQIYCIVGLWEVG